MEETVPVITLLGQSCAVLQCLSIKQEEWVQAEKQPTTLDELGQTLKTHIILP